jgi:hypothetical protein
MFGLGSAVTLLRIAGGKFTQLQQTCFKTIWQEQESSMSRTFSNFIRLIGNFRYYRRNGHDLKTAWNLANMTLP